MGTPLAADAMNRCRPTGGVMSATSMLKMRNTPYCTGSMPSSRTMGKSSGVVITFSEMPSRNMPRKKSATETHSRNSVGDRFAAWMTMTSRPAKPVAVSAFANTFAPMMMRKMAADIVAVRVKTRGMSRQASVRYQKRAATKAPSELIALISVGVKLPV